MLSEREKKEKQERFSWEFLPPKSLLSQISRQSGNVEVNNLFQKPLTASLKSFVLKSFI